MGDNGETQDLATEWGLLLEWLHEHAFLTAARIDQEGSWPMETVEAERITGVAWPYELRTWFWLHDGDRDDVAPRSLLLPGWQLLGLTDAVLEHSLARAASDQLPGMAPPRVAGGAGAPQVGDDPVGFVPELIPVARDLSGRLLVVDLRPGAGLGSVRVHTQNHGDPGAGPVWPDLASMVSDLRHALRDGTPFLGAVLQDVGAELVWRLASEGASDGAGLSAAADGSAGPSGFGVVFGRASAGRREPPPPEEYDEAARMLAWESSDDGAPEGDFALGTDYDGPDLRTVWREMLSWLEEHAPASAALVNTPGAAPAEIASAEAGTGLEWTDELRTWFTLQGGTSPASTYELLDGYEIVDLATSLTVRAMALEVQARVDQERDQDELDDEGQEPAEAGTGCWGFDSAFVVIGDSHTLSLLVVDLRPGPLRGCVLEHQWEDGGATRPDLGWPCIAAKLWDLLCAAREGRAARDGAVPVITPDGRLDWTYS
jgi:cell wall assembly regulator SMI1